MPPGGNKNRRQFSPRGKKLRTYYIFLLIGPAVFFLLYWLYSGGAGDKPGDLLTPPDNYRQAGEPITVDGQTLLAAPGGRVLSAGELALSGNRVMAEAGLTFTVIPLAVPENLSDPSPSRWYLIGGDGIKYNLLKVVAKNPLEGGPQVPPPDPGKRLLYLIFKVPKEPGEAFLVYSPGPERWAWKLPAPVIPGK